MSENRFADCATVEHVLRSLLPIEPPEVWDALEADALARIAELTQPVVDGAARERAIYAIRQWWNEPGRDDRIIDALGYTPPNLCDELIAETERLGLYDRSPASPPVVELTPAELRKCADIVEQFREIHHTTYKLTESDDLVDAWPVPIMDAQLPVVVTCSNADWVLRIGGTDE